MVPVAKNRNYGWLMLLLFTGLYHRKDVRAFCNSQVVVIAALGRACADSDELLDHVYSVVGIAKSKD
jgi:hypothetical protein